MIDLTPARELCKKFEGFRSAPYLCPAGVPTIGYGTTHYSDGRKVQLTDPPIQEEQAVVELNWELLNCENELIRLSPGFFVQILLTGHIYKWNAIVDFLYNLGPGNYQASTLRKCVENVGRWSEVPYQLSRWKFGGGKVLPGLVLRRAMEAQYWNKE
jgi:lysozyme